MSMDREAYRLANEIKTEFHAKGDFLAECPGEEEMKHYKSKILHEIKKEKRDKRLRRGLAAAACAAVALAVGSTVFGEEVYAALQQMKWSMSSALGLTEDLAGYSEVIHTSLTDHGYVLTLQEVVVAEEKLVTNYTLAREDGSPLEDLEIPGETVYINGKRVNSGGSGSAEFLDELHTVMGVVCSQDIELDSGIDLSEENEFCLAFEQADAKNGKTGAWEFVFTADGAALMADTRRIAVGKTFELPDGVTLTIQEITFNALEQRITYELSDSTRWMPMIWATASDGEQVKFGVRSQSAGAGYMTNEEIIEDGRIREDAKAVTLTLYAQNVPESGGNIAEEYMQIGDPILVEL